MSRVLNDIYKIQKAIREKTLVIFVGAGVSANSNVPTWGDLITKIAKELNLQREIQQNEYLKIAQYYYNKAPKNHIFQLPPLPVFLAVYLFCTNMALIVYLQFVLIYHHNLS